MIGSIFIFFNFRNTNGVILKSLAFASGVMICICITDLIPSSFNGFNSIYNIFVSCLSISIFIIIGIIIAGGINKYLPDNSLNTKNKNLYRVGFISMIAIILHNIPEGIATFMLSSHDLKLGISMAIAIALHNIPEGISISIPIFYSTGSKTKSLLFTFISGISELVGAVISYFFLSKYINELFMNILLSIIAGIMLYIPIYELLPESLSYNNRKSSVLFFLIGVLFMIISHFLFK